MLIKLISAGLFALIIFQAWTNIEEVQLVKEQKNAYLFAPIKTYLSNYIKNIEGDSPRIVFSELKTETLVPGRSIIGKFDLSYDQAKNNKDIASRAHFEGTVELTSIDGNDWVANIKRVQNVKQEFSEPMYIQVSK